MNIRGSLCFLVLLLSALTIQARDLVSERAWVEDPSGNMTLLEARQAKQTPIANELFTQGYSHSTFWIRLRIDPEALEDKSIKKLVVRLRPPYQDQIWIYDSLAPQDKARVTGDYYDWADDEYRSLNLNFVIPVGDQPRDIWLRIKSTVSSMTFIEVMTEDQVRAADRRQEIATMLYLSILFVCFGWAALTRINKRDQLLTYYLIREFFVIAYALAILGYVRVFGSDWLPFGWLDFTTNFLGLAFPAVVIWFDSRLIAEFKPNPWLARLYTGLIFFFPVELALVLMGKMIEAVRLNSIVIIAAIFLAVACTISTRAWVESRHEPEDMQPICSKGFLIFLYGLVAIVALLHRLPLMGAFVGHQYFVYLNLVYPLLTSITLMALVQMRLYRLSRYQLQKQQRLELAEIEARTEKAQRIEQANFLKMLAHEMKTPLSVVRMTVSETAIPEKTYEVVDRAVTDMNNIIERLLQVERLEDRRVSVSHQDFDLLEMVNGLSLSLPGGSRLHVNTHGQTRFHSDQQLVRVILSNLLENALKYSPQGSVVNIEINGGSDLVSIIIQNEVGGAGFPDSKQVFNKYYRSDLAHERTGSGLGLYLVKSLVLILGGFVQYIPGVDKIQFELELPRQLMKV